MMNFEFIIREVKGYGYNAGFIGLNPNPLSIQILRKNMRGKPIDFDGLIGFKGPLSFTVDLQGER